MATYQIINVASGWTMGVYEAIDGESAIREMMDDAGSDEEPSPDLQAFPVDLDEIQEQAEEAGLQVQRAENGTLRFTSEDGVQFWNREEWLWPQDAMQMLEHRG